ncbi:MAG: DUF3019 domain-containing protein [Pseudomonadota bacterium]|uniref:DUF3019 domain-containing protein n=1 Tax=Gallaecimonas pentaromativorans TaxID=584787 RepID=UPI00067ECEFD|nr:DUF3019 domain-containing protein [Pseudomonadota bacterium]
MKWLGLVFLMGNSGALKAPQVELQPRWCVAAPSESSCKADVQVQWSQPEPLPLCLYRQEQQLKCWPAALQGQWQGEVKADTPQLFKLILTDGTVIWQGSWQVLFTQHVKRRNRMPWSLH